MIFCMRAIGSQSACARTFIRTCNTFAINYISKFFSIETKANNIKRKKHAKKEKSNKIVEKNPKPNKTTHKNKTKAKQKQKNINK